MEVFSSPESALNQNSLAEKLLYKLQNSMEIDEEIEKLYRYFDVLCHENTQFFSYKIAELEQLMDRYRENIILSARDMASKNEYKEAVEFLENKSEIFKDKTTINSLISHYSKFFIADGLFLAEGSPFFLSVNKLVAFPSIAFKDNPKSEEIDNKYLTSKEFQTLLSKLYENDYILIDIENYIEVIDKKVFKRDLYLPQNKKPLILIFNEANYFENEPYFIDKFIIDGIGEISCFSARQPEKDQISSDCDFIPILEKFIKENNDFSFKNARAIISFENTGNVLGYNISKTNPNINQDSLSLKRIVQKLKDMGYKFAFGDFGIDEKTQYDEKIKNIENNMANIFGQSTIYFSKKGRTNNINELKELGFNIFFEFGDSSFYIKNNVAIVKTTLISGKFLRDNKSLLGIDTEKIYDHNNRNKLF